MKTLPSIETQRKMHAFFMETSAPRLYRELLEKGEIEEFFKQKEKEAKIVDSNIKLME